jgi:hypothetical protein
LTEDFSHLAPTTYEATIVDSAVAVERTITENWAKFALQMVIQAHFTGPEFRGH